MSTTEKPVSRQRAAQIRNIANGMCAAHKTRPIFKANYCVECYAKLGVKRSHPSKNDWASVDWSLSPTRIAAILRITPTAVYVHRKKYVPNASYVHPSSALAKADWSLPWTEIADAYGIPYRQVMNYAKKHEIRNSRVARWDSVDWSLSNAEIARKLNASIAATRYQRKKHLSKQPC